LLPKVPALLHLNILASGIPPWHLPSAADSICQPETNNRARTPEGIYNLAILEFGGLSARKESPLAGGSF